MRRLVQSYNITEVSNYNYTFSGPATIGTFVTLLFIIPINGWIVRVQNTIQKELLTLKGYRVSLMNEILCGIKVDNCTWGFAINRFPTQ